MATFHHGHNLITTWWKSHILILLHFKSFLYMYLRIYLSGFQCCIYHVACICERKWLDIKNKKCSHVFLLLASKPWIHGKKSHPHQNGSTRKSKLSWYKHIPLLISTNKIMSTFDFEYAERIRKWLYRATLPKCEFKSLCPQFLSLWN